MALRTLSGRVGRALVARRRVHHVRRDVQTFSGFAARPRAGINGRHVCGVHHAHQLATRNTTSPLVAWATRNTTTSPLLAWARSFSSASGGHTPLTAAARRNLRQLQQAADANPADAAAQLAYYEACAATGQPHLLRSVAARIEGGRFAQDDAVWRVYVGCLARIPGRLQSTSVADVLRPLGAQAGHVGAGVGFLQQELASQLPLCKGRHTDGESHTACLERALRALAAGYVPATSVSGIQPGLVFGSGEFGLGFYPDPASALAPAPARDTAEEGLWSFRAGCAARLLAETPQLTPSEAALLRELPELEQRARDGVAKLGDGSSLDGSSLDELFLQLHGAYLDVLAPTHRKSNSCRLAQS